MIDAKMRRYAIESRRAELTNKELDRLTDDMKIYRQVGRMWIQQPKKVLVENLKGTAALKTVEAQQMRQVRMKLEEKARGEADGLKELIGVDRFKDLFDKVGQQKPDPSKQLAEMEKKDNDKEMPLFGKPAAAPASAPTDTAEPAPTEGKGGEPEAA